MSVNVITAILFFIMLAMVGRGYVPILFMNLPRWVNWFVAGVLLLSFMSWLRSLYWDVGQALAGDHWLDVREFLGGQEFSTLFNVLGVLSCWALLVARKLLIPEPDQSEWHWWNAWLHPCQKCRFWRRKKKAKINE